MRKTVFRDLTEVILLVSDRMKVKIPVKPELFNPELKLMSLPSNVPGFELSCHSTCSPDKKKIPYFLDVITDIS